MINRLKIITGRSKEFYASKEEFVTCFSMEDAREINRNPIAWECLHEYYSIEDLILDIRMGFSFCNIYEVPKDDKDKKILTERDDRLLKAAISHYRRKHRDNNYYPSKEELHLIHQNQGMRGKSTPFYKTPELSGYLKNSYREIRYLKGTQIIWIDIDGCYLELSDFIFRIQNLGLCPTLYYTTYNDETVSRYGDNQSLRKLRLLYIFDEILSKEEAQVITRKINTVIKENFSYPEVAVDTCSEKITQTYYGNPRPDIKIKNYGIIFNKSKFLTKDDDLFYIGCENKAVYIEFDTSLTGFLIKHWGKCWYDVISQDINKRDPEGAKRLNTYEYFWEADENLFSEVIITPEGTAVRKWKENYPNTLILLDEDNKLTDGCHRRRVIAFRALIRRLMRPDASPNNILHDMYIDLYRFTIFQGGQNELEPKHTIDWMKDEVRGLFSKTNEELYQEYEKYWNGWYWDEAEKNNPNLDRNDIRRRYERKITPLTETDYRTCHKELRWMEYDRILKGKEYSTTNEEKLEILKANGIFIDISTVEDYSRQRGYLRKNWKSLIKKGMKPKEVNKILKENGYSISKGTINNYLSKLNKEG